MQNQERTTDASITIHKQVLVGNVLADQPTQTGEHGNSAVRNLRFPPASNLLNRGGIVQQIERIKNFGKWLADSWQSLGICEAAVAGVSDFKTSKKRKTALLSAPCGIRQQNLSGSTGRE